MTRKIACILAILGPLNRIRPGPGVRTQADQGRCGESRENHQR
jgi:hypothetical protein